MNAEAQHKTKYVESFFHLQKRRRLLWTHSVYHQLAIPIREILSVNLGMPLLAKNLSGSRHDRCINHFAVHD